MLPLSLFKFADTACRAGDWTLVILITTVLVQLSVIGPKFEAFGKGLSSMYRFRSPDTDLYYPVLSQSATVAAIAASCSALALLLVCILPALEPDPLLRILSFAVFLLLFFLIKLALYSSVNGMLYRKQTITVKPVRWNCFFIMVFTYCGLAASLLSAMSFFMFLPPAVTLAAIVVIVSILELGCIFKLKISLLKNRCTIFGFFIYLCALEFSPLAAMWLILA